MMLNPPNTKGTKMPVAKKSESLESESLKSESLKSKSLDTSMKWAVVVFLGLMTFMTIIVVSISYTDAMKVKHGDRSDLEKRIKALERIVASKVTEPEETP